MLQAKLFERAEQIVARRTGRNDREWIPEDMSLLTAIMGITKEVRLTTSRTASHANHSDNQASGRSGEAAQGGKTA